MNYNSFYIKIKRWLGILEPIFTIVFAGITAYLGFQVNKISEVQVDMMKKQYYVEENMEKIALAESETNLGLKELTARQNEYIKIQTEIQKHEESRKELNCDVLARGFIVPTKNQFEHISSQIGKYNKVPENRIIVLVNIINNSQVPLSIKSIQFIPEDDCKDSMYNDFMEMDIIKYYGLSDDKFIKFTNLIQLPITIDGYQSLSGEIFFGGKYMPNKDVSEGFLRFNTNRGSFDRPYSLMKMPGVSQFVEVAKLKKEYEVKKNLAEILVQYDEKMEDYNTDFNEIYEEVQMLQDKHI